MNTLARLNISRQELFVSACALAAVVFFPLGLLWWGWRRRHRVALAVTAMVVIACGAEGLFFFLGLRATYGYVYEWYEPLGMANFLALLFLAFRGSKESMSRSKELLFYVAIGALSVTLLGLPRFLWRPTRETTPYFWVVLAAQLLWDVLFVYVAVSYPPMDEARRRAPQTPPALISCIRET
jgi:hypothetical protein